ncbi:MAG: 3-dehydroquinate synthase [Bacteroidales bacterium]|nr:3-dehydroquinate synthase [Bacteroidales bacterium]
MEISLIKYELIISRNIIKKYETNKIFVLVDENTNKFCFPVLRKIIKNEDILLIKIKSGEDNKSIEAVIKIWDFLSNNGANRKSLLVNLGGGMVCDIGGFAASTFKRGIDFINIPTTLLAQVDASIGGKTGFNFNKLKNEIGLINPSVHIIIDTIFLKTLDKKNILAGYAEMMKHALISDENHWNEIKNIDIFSISKSGLTDIIKKSINIKKQIVIKDPYEKGIRKALNFGHTFGHAFESFALSKNQQLLHGEAVALGIIPELFLSYKKLGFSYNKLEEISNFIISKYSKFPIMPSEYTQIINFMKHDKKNEDNRIMFTLLENIGNVKIKTYCSENEIIEALDFYNKL